jgi:hypothetical protein
VDSMKLGGCHDVARLDDDADCAIRWAYEKHDLEIAALSGYTHLTPRQEEEHLANVASLCRLSLRAPVFGARQVASWSGWRGERLLDADPSI